MSILSVTDKVILVTGAGSGIGRGLALGLLEMGAKVFGFDRNPETLEESRALSKGGALEILTGDVSVEADVVAATNWVIERAGHLDVVFANAGVAGHPLELDKLTIEEWRRVHSINLDGAFLTTREAARHMRARGAGKIVITASTWGVRGTRVAPFTAYASSKGALVNLTRQLALELAPFNVTVNAILPGGFATNMANGVLDDSAAAALLARMPMGRFATPEAMVGPAAFLASAASDWVTGALLPVDGGYLAE